MVNNAIYCICDMLYSQYGGAKQLKKEGKYMIELVSQVFGLVEFVMVFIAVIYISHLNKKRKLKKFNIKFKDITVTKEFFEK